MATPRHRLPDPLPSPLAGLLACATPRSLDRLSCRDFGIAARLVDAAWNEYPPCTIPDNDTFPVVVTGITPAEWSDARPAVFRALEVAPRAAEAGGAVRLVLQAVQRVYQQLQDEQAERRRRTDAATNARLCKQKGGPISACTSRARDENVTSTSSASAPSLRSNGLESSALALQRSPPCSAIQSAQTDSAIETWSAGARALLEDKVKAWRRKKSLGMLQEAIGKWRAMDVTTYPVQDASVLADGPHSSPARVEYLIERANGDVAANTAAGKHPNPIAILIRGLGLKRKGPNKPEVVPLAKLEEWAVREADTLQILESEAAIRKLAKAKTASLDARPVGGFGGGSR